MIFRNSTNSVLRMPLKTVLFTLLIVAVTAFLYLGVNTWAASTRMMSESDENYTTIVTMEYIGENYPDESAYDESMLREVAGIDFSAIANNENVLLWQPADCTIGLVDGFVAHFDSVPYRFYCVLVVSDIHQYQQDGPYYGTLVESLYSYRTYTVGRGVYIYNDIIDGLVFEPDPNATYVIHGLNNSLASASLDVNLTDFYSYAATLSGVDCEAVAPYTQIESAEALHAEPDNVYLSIADYYNVMNNKVYVYRTRALADLEEFNQNRLRLLSGRLFTEQEAASGAKVCVISQTIADNRGLKVGDTITLRTADNASRPAADCYWGSGSMAHAEDYEIVGIVNYYEGLQFNVYVPGMSDSAQPRMYIYKLGQATIKNGSADAFVAAISPLLPEHIQLDVYDQGYQAVADSLSVIKAASAALSAVALVATFVVLVFFSYLFVEKQRDAIETMRCLGTSKVKTRLYLVFGAGLVALAAVALGVCIGTRYAQGLIVSAYDFVSELLAVDTRYSNGYLGITKEFTFVPVASVPLALMTGGASYLLSLSLCLYFAHRTIEGQLLEAKAKRRDRRPPRRSSATFSGAFRYSLLSVRRGGARSLVVPALSAVMLLFVATLQATSASYASAREKLYDETDLRGYFTTMDGKIADNLIISPKYAGMLIDSGYLENVTLTYHMHYLYVGVVRHADGSQGGSPAAPNPDNPYAMEDFLNQLWDGSYLVFTNSAADAPEFHSGEFNASFLPGWDASSFASRDWAEPFCIVSTQFMEKNGVELGDTIRLSVLNGYGYSDGPPFVVMELKVVGSFYRQDAEEQIYCPLSGGAINPEGMNGSAAPVTYNQNEWYDENLTAQRRFDMMLSGSYIASGTFTVKDNRTLSEFKDYLEDLGFSGPKQERSIRVALMFEDSDFNESLNNLVQRSKYMEILYPILLALCCAVGAISSYLMVNSRREDFAVMRGLGTPKRRIFLSMFGEQLLLLATGTVLGGGAWFFTGGAAQLAARDTYAFSLFYALGATVSTAAQIGKKAFFILSEKE